MAGLQGICSSLCLSEKTLVAIFCLKSEHLLEKCDHQSKHRVVTKAILLCTIWKTDCYLQVSVVQSDI